MNNYYALTEGTVAEYVNERIDFFSDDAVYECSESGVYDLQDIAEANYLCDDLGLDTISTGVTISCAMELSTRGIIAENISFEDGEAVT